MSKKSVRENLTGLSKPGPKPLAAKAVKSVGSSIVRGAALIGSEVMDSVISAGSAGGEGAVMEEGQEAVAEAFHEIDELNEVRGEALVRQVSRGEKNADAEEIANRLEEAEGKLARAVEERIHATGHAAEPKSKISRKLSSLFGKKAGLSGKGRRR